MIGLEYILLLYNLEQQELADKLGIKKQNINLWIKKKQSISKKHLPALEEIFGISEGYFQKEVTDRDKILIQMEKLKIEAKSLIIKEFETNEEIKQIQIEIDKARLVEEYREIVSLIKETDEIEYLKDINRQIKNSLEKSYQKR